VHKKIAYLFVGSAEPHKTDEKQMPDVGGSTASVPILMARPESQPSTSSSITPANIANGQARELVQANGEVPEASSEAIPEAAREVAKPASPLEAPTSTVTEPVDKMDIDVLEQSNVAEKAVDEDVEMTNIQEEDSSSDDSDSSDESSSDEEEMEVKEPSIAEKSKMAASPAVEKTNTQSPQQNDAITASKKVRSIISVY
jgi:hypothetical protein